MRVKDPFVKLIEVENNLEHVANCATICYGNSKSEKPERLYNNLIAKNHISMLRHASHYYILYTKQDGTFYDLCQRIKRNHNNGLGCHYEIDKDMELIFLVTNGNYEYDHDISFKDFEVNKEEFEQYENARELVRYTFHIGTSIDITRELNRVSPNNIAERSTRFCDYNKDKFGNDVTVSTYFLSPRAGAEGKDYKEFREGMIELSNSTDDQDAKDQIASCIKFYDSLEIITEEYKRLKDLPNDVKRKLLPLQTYSEVVYTYTVKEWRNVINLRYFGKTGKPHPDSQFIAMQIKELLENEGYDFHK